MPVDVVCLRPEADFLAVGVVPPADLHIAYTTPGDPALPGLLKEARALVIPAVGPPLDPGLFRDSALRLVQVTGAGLDRLDRRALADAGIVLANVPGGSNAAVAEYCIACALWLLRGFGPAGAAIRAGRYAAQRSADVAAGPRGLGGLTVGLVGLGTIGYAVAERFHSLGAGLMFHDPAHRQDAAALARIGARESDLASLLGEADVVSLHVPLVDATRSLIDAAGLARMKPGAVLLNPSRGGIVDEAALAAALSEGRIAGAAVDVYATEPPAPDNPLLTLPDEAAARLILTPHVAGVSRQASGHLFREAWENVRRVLVAGEPARNAAP